MTLFCAKHVAFKLGLNKKVLFLVSQTQEIRPGQPVNNSVLGEKICNPLSLWSIRHLLLCDAGHRGQPYLITSHGC